VPEGIYRLMATDPGGQLNPIGDLVTVLGPDTAERATNERT
jgi:hypothetical protein